MIFELPSSKSMTQRALMIGALSGKEIRLCAPLECDDSSDLIAVLKFLGKDICSHNKDLLIGASPFKNYSGIINCGHGASILRFGAALSLILDGALTLDGSKRLRERPLLPLMNSLQALGVSVDYLEEKGSLPVRLCRKESVISSVFIDASLSSQFASAIFLVAPYLTRGLEVELSPKIVSLPYLKMTTKMMERSGINLEWQESNKIKIFAGEYFPSQKFSQIEIEGDWSSASFLLAASFITSKEIKFTNLPLRELSLQGDSSFELFLEEIKRSVPHNFNLVDTPDLIAPLVIVSLFASDKTIIKGAYHARLKESDRIHMFCQELKKIGADIRETFDGLEVCPLADLSFRESIVLDAADDHRLAMAFGILSLKFPKIQIAGKDSVTKSFPRFWEHLAYFN